MAEDSSDLSHRTSIAAPSTCPNMPHALVAAATPFAALLRSERGTSRFETSPQSLVAAALAPASTTHRTWPKRGP